MVPEPHGRGDAREDQRQRRDQGLHDEERASSCARGRLGLDCRGRVRLHPRPQRMRQDHPPLGHVGPPRADTRAHPARRAPGDRPSTQRDRVDLPGGELASVAEPRAEHPLSVRDQADQPGRRESTGSSERPGSPGSSMRTPASCRVGCSSGRRSCAPSPRPRCC